MVAQKKIAKISWDKAQAAPIVLISGPENFLADRAFKTIRNQLRQQDPELAVHELNADTYAAGELATLASPSLFGEPRLIRVSSVEKCNDQFLVEAKEIVALAMEDTTIVFRHSGGMRGKALLDAIRKNGANAVEIEAPKIGPRDRMPLVANELKSSNVRFDHGVVEALLDAYQDSLEELIGATRQVAELSTTKHITVSDVEKITGGRVEAGGFRVADAAIAGNPAQALVLARQALNTGAVPVQLLGALNMKLRTMAKIFGAGESDAELASFWGMQAWQVRNARRDLRGWREADLAKTIAEAANTEMLLKGGSRDPLYVFERFVLLVANKGRNLKGPG